MERGDRESTWNFLSRNKASSGKDDKPRSSWMFRRIARKEPAVLDRVISISQPDLVYSSRRDEEPQERPKSGGADKSAVAHLVLSHHKSSSLGSAGLEGLKGSPGGGEEATTTTGEQLDGAAGLGAALASSGVPPERAGLYKLEVDLRRGHNLAVRDRRGSSDPYVKLKMAGKEVFRSKTVHKNLNPVWEEKTTVLVDDLSEPLYVKVFDYDFGLQDDFMGSAQVQLDSLELQRTIPLTVVLKDPLHPDEYLGTLELAVMLTPKDSPVEERRDSMCDTGRFRPFVYKTMLLRRSWKRSTKHQQSLRLSELHRKSQLWRGIVSIALIEGRDLVPMDPNGLSDPFVKFRLGQQKYRSKTVPKTLSPQWREQFDLHVFEETGGVLEVSVWDYDTARRDDFIGRCQLDLSSLDKEQTHLLDLPLEETRGHLVLLVTLTASTHISIADLSITPLDDPQERAEILRRYGALKSFSNMKDVGIVQVKVLRAEDLMAADMTGKSDPFCVLELNNDRLQTHTVYKNLNPEWNKVFTFNVKDIHSVLEVTVLDEDRDRSADFLGKVAIPLLHVNNGQQKPYALKDKELKVPTKGLVFLEIDIVYNTVKAALRTVTPAEQKFIKEEPKVSVNMLRQNFMRVRRSIMVVLSWGAYVNSCFEWESSQRSVISFLLFVVGVWHFELFMLPLALLLLLVWSFFSSGSRDAATDTSVDAMSEWDDDDDVDDKDAEPRGFMDKLYAVQDILISVQNMLDQAASFAERLKNVLNWTVPFLSCLAIAALCLATLLLYLVPLRYVVLAWGVNKFTKKLRDPYMINNNELLDFLSRVPSDVQVMQYRQLKVDSSQSPNKRRRTNPS
ncbi:multiple C2 and transmembrane domain-containing protein 1-like isoform X2 [Entelurus aequoreus]|uniref:multiple C2 and transmembrane domain-containing protein 1-like isoform X2 n=1 Tax=Entelurus aequoreus TaxID=161455 RepID=UPI002B1DB964|nr:multiple C2 and transmembrane domain-containing protein 1-like isoform X2 [Entelurus aequoreus]